jgi:hypothetical protein
MGHVEGMGEKRMHIGYWRETIFLWSHIPLIFLLLRLSRVSGLWYRVIWKAIFSIRLRICSGGSGILRKLSSDLENSVARQHYNHIGQFPSVVR